MEKEELIKRLQGMGIEIGGGVATDVLTGALLNPLTLKATAGLSGVAYGAINFGQGAYTNYLVQRHLYGNEDINWGEVIGSGASFFHFSGHGYSCWNWKCIWWWVYCCR